MLNFKFIKRASVVLILFIAVLWSNGVAFAGFVRTSVQEQEEENLNQINGAAAAIEAIPAKTDGEIANCFDYYRFPSIQTSFETLKEFYEPGQTVYFKGELINENSYPIADGYLFVRIGRYNKNYIKEGHDIVDEFFANSGPEGREKFYLEGKEKKGTVFSWNAPKNLPEGVYTASFSFVVGKKMNLAGLSFTNEVVAGLTRFEIGKSAAGTQRVFLEKSSFAVNGKKYDHIGLSPVFDKGAKVETVGKIRNDTAQKANLKLVYDLYYWDGLDDKNKISSRSEDITIASNSSRSFQYVIPKMDETVYFLRITAVAGDGQKSIVNLRFLSEQEKPRINFFSPMKFPVLAGETITSFACFHNTADKSAPGKVTMNIFDESGDKIQTLGYEGEITGRIMAVKKDAVAAKNYDYLRMAASVAGADGRETDSYEMIYDCKNMNPKNKECLKIQEKKAMAGVSAKPSDKKAVAVGIIALAAIMAIAALLRKFFINKTKSPLISLFFAFAVGSAVFLASGMGDYASAKDVTVIENYNFPPGVDCNKNVQGKGIYVGPIWGGDPLWICASGSIQIMHEVIKNNSIKINNSDVVDVDEIITFSYSQYDPYYYVTSGANDSPFGEWCADLSDKSCLVYEQIGYVGTNDQATIKDNIDMTWLAVKPEVYMTSDSSAVVCDRMTCTAKEPGKATLTAHIDKVTARAWFKLYAGKGWEGSRYDYKGVEKMPDIDFAGATLTWEIAVDPPPPTCTASFTPAVIEKGESTKFQFNPLNDNDNIALITCATGTTNEYNFDAISGVYYPISPETTQTCTATVENDKGAATCQATVTVTKTKEPVVPSQPQNFTASAACKAVNLSWNIDTNGEYNDPVGNTGSKVVKYYEITRDGSYIVKKSDNINRWDDTSKKFTDDNNSYTDSGTTDSSKEYSYTIKACNDKGECSADAGPATATPNPGPCPGGTTSSTPTSSTPTSSSSSKSSDPDWYNLTFKTSGSGSGNATRYHYDDNTLGWTGSKTMNNGDKAGIGRDYKFKLVPNPSSGSYFSSWSGCGSVNSDNECLLEKNPYPGADKTVTATFNSDSTGGCVGCGGGSSVKAYISAQDTVVTDGNSTVVTWTSDNATSCEQKEESSGNDPGWTSAANTASGNYTTTNFTTSGGPRTYKVTCTDGSQSADAEVTVSVGSDYTGSPSATMWADPQSVGYKKTSKIKWMASNIMANQCEVLYSGTVDSMGGYMKWYNVPPYTLPFGSGYYKPGIGTNNTTGQITGKLASDTTYKIQCGGYGPSYSKVTAQTTVTVAKPVSNFTLTNPTGGSLIATIVEVLSANSSSLVLALSGETIGNVSLSASVPAIPGAKAQFATSADNGGTWSAWSGSPLNDIDISATPQIKIRAINIPGATATGTYNTVVTATDTGKGGKTKKLNINLQVNKVSSEWKEF